MSIAQAEELKRKYTDKFVVVQDGVPELRRFSGLTGKVKTVNMNCRALVQFDGPADIAWYDIDPNYLRLVDAPLPKKAAAGHGAKEAAPSKETARPAPEAAAGKGPLELARQQGAAKAPAAAPVSGEKKLSPLELARQQGAAKAETAAPKPVQTAGNGEKKLSPLELARQQGAARKDGTAPTKTAGAPAHAAAPSADGGKKLSPLELARQQGAARRSGDAPATVKSTVPAAEESAPAARPAPPPVAIAASEQGMAKSSSERVPTPGSTAEIIALARQQGPFKG